MANSTCSSGSGSIFSFFNSKHIEINGAYMHHTLKNLFYVYMSVIKITDSKFSET